jgi:hypothetical protein
MVANTPESVMAPVTVTQVQILPTATLLSPTLSPMAEHTDAEKLRSAEITLATIREHAERATALPADVFRNDHAHGYERAMRGVLAILDARWLPEGTPVILPGD